MAQQTTPPLTTLPAANVEVATRNNAMGAAHSKFNPEQPGTTFTHMITLPPKEKSDFLASVRAELVQRLVTEHRDDLQCLTPIQTCALLSITPQTLAKIKELRPVTIIPGSVVRYLAADVAAFIQSRKS